LTENDEVDYQGYIFRACSGGPIYG